MDLESLDFEAMEKEMATDEVAQAAQAAIITLEGNALEPTKADNGEAGV